MKEVHDSLDLDSKIRRIAELDKSMEEPGFWDNAEKAAKLVQECKNLKDTVELYHSLEQEKEDIETMIDMGNEEEDLSLLPEVEEMMGAF